MIVHDENNVPEFKEMLRELSSKEIKIGILGEGKGSGDHTEGEDATILEVAHFNEYGTKNMPERSFIRASFDDNQEDYAGKGEKLLRQVIAMETKPKSMYKALGEHIVGKTQEFLTELTDPPNSPITIALKGSSNPLIDTGQLRDSIEHKVVDK